MVPRGTCDGDNMTAFSGEVEAEDKSAGRAHSHNLMAKKVAGNTQLFKSKICKARSITPRGPVLIREGDRKGFCVLHQAVV